MNKGNLTGIHERIAKYGEASITPMEKALIRYEDAGFEKERMYRDERDAMLSLCGIVQELSKGIQVLDKRARKVNGCLRDLKMLQAKSVDVLAKLIWTMTDDQSNTLIHNSAACAYGVVVRRAGVSDESGTYISNHNLDVLTQTMHETCCLTCLLDDGEAKECPVRKALDSIGTNIQHGKHGECGYRI